VKADFAPSRCSLAILLFSVFCLGLIPVQGRADFVTVPGSDNDGSLAATIKFTTVSGGVDITVTNNETGTLAKGQAISALSFSFTAASGLSATGFTELKGTKANSAGFTPRTSFPGNTTVTPVDDKSSTVGAGAIDHWGFQPTALSVALGTAGSHVSGATGHPHYMILPSLGTTGPARSLADGHFDPYLLGPANFFLKVSGHLPTVGTDLTADITNVSVGFGTGPDKTLQALPSVDPPTVPVPPSAVLLALGGLGLAIARRGRDFLGVGWRRPVPTLVENGNGSAPIATRRTAYTVYSAILPK
jgi:hypothetical protein